jgi:hypothetical protein
MTAKIDGTNGLLQQYDYQTPTTGFSYTFAAGTQMLFMVPAATLATGTIRMPASPTDGMTITFSSSQQITALTLQGNTGQSISNAATILPAQSAASYVYRQSNATWYPCQSVPSSPSSSYAGPGATIYTTAGSNTFTIPSGITKLKVTVVGGGGGAYYEVGCNPYNGGAGGTSSVASGTQTISTISATGGGGGTPAQASGGLGSGGDLNARGAGANGLSNGASSSLSAGQYSNGSGLLGSSGVWGGYRPGGAGGTATKWLTGLTAGNTLSVTVGAGGTSTSGYVGGAGAVILEY